MFNTNSAVLSVIILVFWGSVLLKLFIQKLRTVLIFAECLNTLISCKIISSFLPNEISPIYQLIISSVQYSVLLYMRLMPRFSWAVCCSPPFTSWQRNWHRLDGLSLGPEIITIGVAVTRRGLTGGRNPGGGFRGAVTREGVDGGP